MLLLSRRHVGESRAGKVQAGHAYVINTVSFRRNFGVAFQVYAKTLGAREMFAGRVPEWVEVARDLVAHGEIPHVGRPLVFRRVRRGRQWRSGFQLARVISAIRFSFGSAAGLPTPFVGGCSPAGKEAARAAAIFFRSGSGRANVACNNSSVVWLLGHSSKAVMSQFYRGRPKGAPVHC